MEFSILNTALCDKRQRKLIPNNFSCKTREDGVGGPRPFFRLGRKIKILAIVKMSSVNLEMQLDMKIVW
jgi:hypothetical protein